MTKKHSTKKLPVNDFASVAAEERFIKKLKEQQKQQQGAEESRKTLHKCLQKLLKRDCRITHQLLSEVHDEVCARYFVQLPLNTWTNEDFSGLFHSQQKQQDAYLTSGIYDKFGNSCTESLKKSTKPEVEAEDLTTASWYQSGIIGKFSDEILEHQSPGSFIIHKASHKSGNFVLSLRVPSKSPKVMHQLIVQSRRGYHLKGATKVFATVATLVTHHSVMAEQLPVALFVQRSHELVKKQKENDDDFSSVEDLGSIFTDLEL